MLETREASTRVTHARAVGAKSNTYYELLV